MSGRDAGAAISSASIERLAKSLDALPDRIGRQVGGAVSRSLGAPAKAPAAPAPTRGQRFVGGLKASGRDLGASLGKNLVEEKIRGSGGLVENVTTGALIGGSAGGWWGAGVGAAAGGLHTLGQGVYDPSGLKKSEVMILRGWTRRGQTAIRSEDTTALREMARSIVAGGAVTDKGEAANRRLAAQMRAAARQIDRLVLTRPRTALRSIGLGPTYFTGSDFVRGFEKQFDRLPRAARDSMSETAIAMARGFERSGRLPRGATERVIKQMEARWGGLRDHLKDVGMDSMKAIERTLADRRTVRAAQRQIDRIGDTWSDAPKLAKTTSRNAAHNWQQNMEFLERKIATTSGRQKQAAQREWDAMAAKAGEVSAVTVQAFSPLIAVAGAVKREIGSLASTFGINVDSVIRSAGALISTFGGTTVGGAIQTGINLVGILKDRAETLAAGSGKRKNAGATGGVFTGTEFAPAFVSSGERVLYGGAEWTVPGARVADDNVFTMLPVGAAVLTDHGQSLYDGGASLDHVLAAQLPHFAAGGTVGRFRRGGRWVKVGGTTYDDSPPGAFGNDLNGFAELGTARRTDGSGTGRGWLARAFGWKGELAAGAAVDFRRDGRTVTLHKRDRGYGQGGDGVTSDPFYAADFWRSSASGIGIGGSWKGSLFARPHSGSVSASGGGAGASGARVTVKQPRITRPRLVDILQPSISDAFSQGFESGLNRTGRLFKSWRGQDTDLFTSALEGIRATADDLPKRIAQRAPKAAGGGSAAPATGDARRRVRAMIAAGRQIAGLPYYYGGGHGGYARDARGYDCSGAVSYLLHAGGFLPGAPVTTDGLKTLGAAGAGRSVTWAVRGSTGANAHTMIRLGRHYFEAGGGGVGWRSGWSGSWDMFRHPAGYRGGGVAGDPRRRDPHSPLFAGWGLASGGRVRGFRGGGGVGARNRRAAEQSVARADQAAVAEQLREQWAAQPAEWKLVDRLRSAGTRDSKGAADKLRRLGEVLEQAGRISYEGLARTERGIRGEIKELHRGGLTGRERVQVRRLRSALTLVETEMGSRIGTWVARAQEAVEAVGTRRDRKSRRLRRFGVSEDSVEGMQALQIADVTSTFRLNETIEGKGGLKQQLKRARKMRDPAAVKAIEEQLAASREALAELQVSIIEQARAIQGAIIQQKVEGVEKEIAQASNGRTRKERDLTRRGVDASSSTGIGELEEADRQLDHVIRSKLGDLQAAAEAARASGNADLQKSINESIEGYVDQLDQLSSDLANAAREKAAAATREVVESASFESSRTSAAKEAFEIQQRMAELNGGPKFDSAQARQARATFIRDNIVGNLRREADALNAQAERAKADRGGSDETYRQAHLAYLAKQNEIASAQLEAEELIKGNTADAAEALKQLGGQMSFSFNGQQFTDVINSGIGA